MLNYASRCLLHDCEIFANLRITFVSSSTTHWGDATVTLESCATHASLSPAGEKARACTQPPPASELDSSDISAENGILAPQHVAAGFASRSLM